MAEQFYDPIVAEVRKNREEIFASFDYDMEKYHQYLDSKRPEWEAAGFRFETEEKRQARLAWNRQQREAEERRVASL